MLSKTGVSLSGHLLVLVALVTMLFVSSLALRRFEPQHSLTLPIGGKMLAANWEMSGNAVLTEEFIRLTPDVQSRVGRLWNRRVVQTAEWEVELTFKVHGGSIGADGLAFWYTDQILPEGPVFGASDRWTGFALIFDSFDNDGNGENPRIAGFYNTGNMVFNYQQDGTGQEIGSCTVNYRNPEHPSRVTIRSKDKMVQVLVDARGKGTYDSCFVANIDLPTNYYLGLTAATGAVSDNHDLYSFVFHNLNPLPIHRSRWSQWAQKVQESKAARDEESQKAHASGDVEQQDQQGSPSFDHAQEQPPTQPAAQQIPFRNHQAAQEPPIPFRQPVPPPQPFSSDPLNAAHHHVENRDVSSSALEQRLSNVENTLNSLVTTQQTIVNALNNIEKSEKAECDVESQQSESINNIISKMNGLTGLLQSVVRRDDFASLIDATLRKELDHIISLIAEVQRAQTQKSAGNEVEQTLSSIENLIRRQSQSLNGISNVQNQLQNSLTSHVNNLVEQNQQTSSYTYWGLFALFQVFFLVAFAYYKKSRDNSQKKLF